MCMCKSVLGNQAFSGCVYHARAQCVGYYDKSVVVNVGFTWAMAW